MKSSMTTADLSFLVASFAPLTAADLADASPYLQRKNIRRGTNLLNERGVCDRLTLLVTGSVRQFTEVRHEEVNFLFYFENDFVLDYCSFLLGEPSKYTLEALEDCQLIQLEKTSFDQLCEQHLRWHAFAKHLAEKTIIRLYKRNEVLLLQRPEERYVKLIEIHPQILQRLPLNKIASFLGITVPSLSRIRKRLTKQRKLT